MAGMFKKKKTTLKKNSYSHQKQTQEFWTANGGSSRSYARQYIFCFLLIYPTEDRPHTLMRSSVGYSIPISSLGLSL